MWVDLMSDAVSDALSIRRVAELWRYPVKSMQGERLSVATVDAAGITGDRQWAVIDLDSGLALTAKREPRLLDSSAAVLDCGDHIEVQIALPDGSVVRGESDASGALSAQLGRRVELRRADPEVAATYEIAADFEAEDTSELLHWSGPAGTFHDSTMTRISVAALSEMRDWAPRRFRINVLVTGTSSRPLVGNVIRIGEVELDVVKHIGRCVLVTRAQPGGIARDLGVLRTINAEMDGELGAGSLVRHGGPIAIGDAVSITAD
jgi:uncharacterized protein YcbX